VFEVSQGVESDANDVVARIPTHGGYERKATRVFVVGRIEETGSFGHSGEAMVWGKKIHDTSPKK
jgi:hypothetical protein